MRLLMNLVNLADRAFAFSLPVFDAIGAKRRLHRANRRPQCRSHWFYVFGSPASIALCLHGFHVMPDSGWGDTGEFPTVVLETR